MADENTDCSAYESKIISADRLKRSNVQRRTLGEYVANIRRYLQDEILKAHKEGRPFLITTIPSVFDVSKMSNKDSQIYIWGKTIEHLEEAGYRVTIKPTKESCLIKIKWKSPQEEEELNIYREIIYQHADNNMDDPK